MLQSSDFSRFIKDNHAVLAYFSHEKCNVCKVLKPKISDLLTKQFPIMKMIYIDTEKQPETAAQNRIFTVPSIIIFFEGREYFRFSRNVSIHQLEQAIERPYSLFSH